MKHWQAVNELPTDDIPFFEAEKELVSFLIVFHSGSSISSRRIQEKIVKYT